MEREDLLAGWLSGHDFRPRPEGRVPVAGSNPAESNSEINATAPRLTRARSAAAEDKDTVPAADLSPQIFFGVEGGEGVKRKNKRFEGGGEGVKEKRKKKFHRHRGGEGVKKKRKNDPKPEPGGVKSLVISRYFQQTSFVSFKNTF